MKEFLIFLFTASLLTVSGVAQTVKSYRVEMLQGGGYLGIHLREVTAEDVTALSLNRESGVVIEEVLPDTPAAEAGLQANDVVLGYAEQPVLSAAQFRRLVSETPAGRTVEITLSRDGQMLTRSVTLAGRKGLLSGSFPQLEELKDLDLEMPHVQIGPDDQDVFVWRGRPRLGIRAEPLTEQMAEFLGVPEKKGVLVMEVLKETPASSAGLRAGDVIVACDGHEVETPADLTRHLDEGTVELKIVRNGSHQTLSAVIENQRKERETGGSSIKL